MTVFTALRDHPENKIKEWDLSSMSDIVPKILPLLAEYISVSGSSLNLNKLCETCLYLNWKRKCACIASGDENLARSPSYEGARE